MKKKSLKELLKTPGNVIKNISAEIVRECNQLNITVSSVLANYFVFLCSLIPAEGFNPEENFDRASIEEFVKKCVHKFAEPDNPTVRIAKIQVVFMSKKIDLESVRIKYDAIIDAKLDYLLLDIQNISSIEKEDLDRLFRKILLYIIAKYKLGKPTNPKVITENTNALNSVITREDLVDLVGMKKRHRMDYIDMLGKLVCGIRVFNKDEGICGEGLRDIVEDVFLAHKNTRSTLNEAYARTKYCVLIGQEVLTKVLNIDSFDNQFSLNLPEDVEEEDIVLYNKYLMLFYQHQNYIQELLNSLNILRKALDINVERFRGVLFQIHEVVQYRIAVPSDLVFPHFTNLALIWSTLLNYLYLFVEVNSANDAMESILQIEFGFKQFALKFMDIVPAAPRPTVASLETQSWPTIRHEAEEAPSSQLQFCAYIFAVTDGFLVPSDLELPIVQSKSMLYAFSQQEYLEIFGANVEFFENKFIRAVRRNPEVIALFDIYDEVSKFEILKPIENMERDGDDVMLVNQPVQTETHPIKEFKDKDYMFSLWDVRRKALQLANLRKCRTKSVQTDVSFYRRNSSIQTVETAEKPMQTPQEQSMNTLKFREI